MNFFFVFGIAFALAMDAFAVAVGVSLKKIRRRQAFRLAFYFGFFQFMMPILGWLAGQSLFSYIHAFDHWVAFGLLLFIGGRMAIGSLRAGEKAERKVADPTKGLSLFMLSLATSIDALAVGLSFAALHLTILYPAVVIGIICFLITAIGTKIGPLIGQLIGKRAELAGGLVLIGIGIKILVDHL
jgi:putative Mn2+ efflux pump MntP